MFLPLNYHLREDKGMRGKDAQVAWPKLGGWDRGSVNEESVIFHVISSSRLKVLHIWAMTQLSLGVAAYDFCTHGPFEPLFLLRLSAHNLQASRKHS